MKTFRWTMPEPHHPPSPVGRSINADENEEIATLARRLDLNAKEEETLRNQLRGYRTFVFSGAAVSAAAGLFFLWIGGPARLRGELNPVWMIGCILLMQSFWQLADGLRRRRLKALLDKIAEAKLTAESNPTPCP